MPPGRYRLSLHFAEVYWGSPKHPGRPKRKRIFDVVVEDEARETAFDLTGEEFATAVLKPYEVVVTDGLLDIEFRHREDHPKISAIEVMPLD